MTDYSTLNDRALDRVIAERLGYEVYKHKTAVTHENYLLVAPHDRPYTLDDYTFLLRAAGNYAYRTDEEEAWMDCNEYSADADEALALWGDIPDDYTPRLVRILVPMGVMTRQFKAGILHNETMEQIEALAATPARAICLAWLAWKDTANDTP